jgi:hypothetical protein
MEKQALINKVYLLEKFPGKAGWTYALIPEIPKEKRFPFGWLKVSGSIDGYAFENLKLMPFGNGQLFLPVKAEIRKTIKKEAGDWVKIILFDDTIPMAVPEDILYCLNDAPLALQRFNQMTNEEKQGHINDIMEAKTQDMQVKKIVMMIEKLNY